MKKRKKKKIKQDCIIKSGQNITQLHFCNFVVVPDARYKQNFFRPFLIGIF